MAAFHILADELRAHGAPAPLVDEARRSAGDEVVHARDVARLARRWGALPGPVEIAARPIRSLEEIAVENAIEGGVRERYGAHLAVVQSQAAGDAETRALYRRIAPDELRHAELAFAIDEWIAGKLGGAARRRVCEAKQAARARLVDELAKEPSPSLQRAVGLPDATRAVEALPQRCADLRGAEGAPRSPPASAARRRAGAPGASVPLRVERLASRAARLALTSRWRIARRRARSRRSPPGPA